MIDWSPCKEVETVADRCHGAPVVKGTRVIVQGILDNAEADETPLQIARMFSLPVVTVRRVLAFAYAAELRDLLDARLAGNWRRESAYRFDRLAHQLTGIDKALKRSPQPKP
jgi:uncharacterized protein (DUF433 family)